MLRRLLPVILVVAGFAFQADDVHAGGYPQRGGVMNYLFGGYGPGPFGHGDVNYAGWTSRTVVRHGEKVPSFTTGHARRANR